MTYTRYNHPKTTINTAKQRFLDDIRSSKVYEIIKYNVWMCDDLERAEKSSLEEIEEDGITLSEDFNIDNYIVVAQYDVAKEQLEKLLNRDSAILSEEEQAEISMLKTLYPMSVTMKGVLIDEFKLN